MFLLRYWCIFCQQIHILFLDCSSSTIVAPLPTYDACVMVTRGVARYILPWGGGPKVSSKGTHVTREFHTLNCPHILPKNHASTLSDAPRISKINWECHVPGGPGPAGRLAKLDRAMSLNMLLYVDTLAWPDPHYDRDVNTLRAPLRILMPRPCVALFDQYWPEGEKEYKRGLRVVLGSSIELSASTMSRAPHAAARVWSHLLSFLGFEDPT